MERNYSLQIMKPKLEQLMEMTDFYHWGRDGEIYNEMNMFCSKDEVYQELYEMWKEGELD